MVASCGKALVDLVPVPGPVPSATGRRRHDALAGGSPRNVARGLGRLGVESALAGLMSTDLFGDDPAEVLERGGVSLDHLTRGERPTTRRSVGMEGQAPTYAFSSERRPAGAGGSIPGCQGASTSVTSDRAPSSSRLGPPSSSGCRPQQRERRWSRSTRASVATWSPTRPPTAPALAEPSRSRTW